MNNERLKHRAMKQAVLETLENNIFAELQFGKYYFCKHVKGTRLKVFQLVFTGGSSDGIYDLTTGEEFTWRKENGILIINANGNLGASTFGKNEAFPEGYNQTEDGISSGYCILRENFDTEESFKASLIQTGMITEEEYLLLNDKKNYKLLYEVSQKFLIEF